MNKKIYLTSLKLSASHALFFSTAIGIYYLSVNTILNAEKLFDILLITKFFELAILIVSFILAVKIAKKKNDKLFDDQHRLILLFHAVNIFILLLAVFVFLVIFKGLHAGFFLLGGSILLLYVYYYFSRLVYYLAFYGKLRKTIVVFTILLATGYLLLLILPIVNYNKVYKETQVKADFIYFHSVDLSEIAGERELIDRNSAKDMVELINMLETDEEIKDEDEELSYIWPTDQELALLGRIANSAYLGFSREYLPEKLYQTGDKLVMPLNGLRSFSRGAVKLAKSEAELGHVEKAQAVLNDLLYTGNQMISAKDGILIGRLVGQAMMEAVLGGVTEIYGEGSRQAELAKGVHDELNAMRDGSRLLRTYATHMNNEMIPTAESAAAFFKHLEAQKDNISGDMDRQIAGGIFPLYYGFDPLHFNDVQHLKKMEKLTVSLLAAPILALFELNIGKDLMIYREARKLSREPGHEFLDFFFKTSFSDFMKRRDENHKKAMEITLYEFFKTK